jgi:hypothetical protein
LTWSLAGHVAKRAAVLAAALAVAACASIGAAPEPTPSGRYEFRLLGQHTFAHRLEFGGTTVGGLSGIDYDPKTDRYFIISDDRSHFAPNRFYVARLSIDERGFHEAVLDGVVTLLAPDDHPYPESFADSEAIRFDPATGTLWWTSEGARKLKSRLIDPFVRRSSLDGRYLGELPLSPMFHITAEPRGPRDNLVFEGLTLAVDGQSLWVSMEGPLIQDGPVPTMTAGAWSRISRFDRTSDGGFGALASQYAYPISPIPAKGAWTTSHAQTGVSEILAVDANHLFVLERALVIGAGWRIRLFEADWRLATDIKAIDALRDAERTFTPMTKELVLDFDSLGIRIDNLEGICFGPTLANGHRTLVLVSDDNFNALQVTQLIALEVIVR